MFLNNKLKPVLTFLVMCITLAFLIKFKLPLTDKPPSLIQRKKTL